MSATPPSTAAPVVLRLSRRQRVQRWLLRGSILVATLLLGLYATGWIVDACIPFPWHALESLPVSREVTDRHGQVILRTVGPDDHWRRPVPLEAMSPWLIHGTLAAEDARFYQHGGVDYWSTLRAVQQLAVYRQPVSGASTITMQVVRQIEGRPRSIPAKLWQMFRARQLEAGRSKRQILETYLNTVSYGGNIRGVAEAARIYYAKPVGELTLGEAALLAGIPQAPNRLRPDRAPENAQIRRAFVLRRLRELGHITPDVSVRAAAEPVRVAPAPLATPTQHVAWWAVSRRPTGGAITLHLPQQRALEDLVQQHARHWPAGTEASVVILDLEQGDIVALVGSVHPENQYTGQVNGALALRSPGSALKPFLYAAAFATHRLGPDSIVPDRPLERAGWSPENFQRTWQGDVTVTEALRQSLNIPAILVTEQTGLTRCIGVLRACGIGLPAGTEQRGGLALAVGGMEVSLLDLTNAYATLGRGGERISPRLFLDEPCTKTRVLPRAVCQTLDHILGSQERVPHGWETAPAASRPWCMWKTGTSSGRRDAWAVGHNRRYAIGVWIGQFSGAGHVAFVGRELAEPLFASIAAAREFRQEQPPESAPGWAITRPLVFPEDSTALRIVQPKSGDRYLALNGTVPVPVQTSRPVQGLGTWFLNGQLWNSSDRTRLELSPGAYELRCVEAGGATAMVRFQVSAPPLIGTRG